LRRSCLIETLVPEMCHTFVDLFFNLCSVKDSNEQRVHS
jgi:hypothetical protein